MKHNLKVFSTSVGNLLNVYHQAVNYFNAGQGKPITDAAWIGLKGLLDPDVICTAIMTVTSYKHPDPVITYLQAADGSFTNDIITQTLPFGNYAVVCGTATWTDAGSPGGQPIIFTFTFVNYGIGNQPNWKILRLAAT